MYSIIALSEKGKVQVCAVGPEDSPRPALFRTLLMAKIALRKMVKDNPKARISILKH